MSSDRPVEYLQSLVHELCVLPRETKAVQVLDGYLIRRVTGIAG